MTQVNYKTMSDIDLLAYVKQHPEDQEAFYVYVDRKRAASNAVPMTLEQAEIELQRRVNQQQ
ncbi:DUF6887 family protein [Nostoc sp. MG11]|uniref:DUF6887 family protein n=1 Tax=Nostoc sp. MG11 TaxID=2721166 RepID=UPI0018678588|nr:hypothetical protein [Nostoc sp. MG11]